MSERRDRRPSTSDALQPDLDLTLLFGSTVSAGGESERVCVLSRSEERRRKRSGQRCVGDQFGGDEDRREGSSLIGVEAVSLVRCFANASCHRCFAGEESDSRLREEREWESFLRERELMIGKREEKES